MPSDARQRKASTVKRRASSMKRKNARRKTVKKKRKKKKKREEVDPCKYWQPQCKCYEKMVETGCYEVADCMYHRNVWEPCKDEAPPPTHGKGEHNPVVNQTVERSAE